VRHTPQYDLAIIGAGAAGLTAADFALQLGARVVLLERDRIGGDCTWSGCVPSKSLLKVARLAAQARTASGFGLQIGEPAADMVRVREYLRSTIRHIYEPTSPDSLRERGLQVHLGAASFVDPHTVESPDGRLGARRFLICTGAVPRMPELPGLSDVSYLTYKDIFENDRLPRRMIVIGGGPVGCEIAQAYQRLGSQVALVAERLLPREEPEVSELLAHVFGAEGVEHVRGRARAVARDGQSVRVKTDHGEVQGDLLFVAVGRSADLADLKLGAAGVRCGARGIEVDSRLRTTVRHIYAAGDVVGGAQYSHLAGWQAFQATRNALLPGSSSGIPEQVPEVTFTSPEVAHIGMNESSARARYGDAVCAQSMDLGHVDRAVSEDDRHGLLKIIAHRDGRILGATIMAERGGDALAELSVAMFNNVRLGALAASIHPYPTYGSAIQLLASQMAVKQRLAGFGGRTLRALARWSLGRG
jgi:pyruvate/2-oxoglutarate dehydrogenase complex dihydrolipoamide dehydrogenase (E3) component